MELKTTTGLFWMLCIHCAHVSHIIKNACLTLCCETPFTLQGTDVGPLAVSCVVWLGHWQQVLWLLWIKLSGTSPRCLWCFGILGFGGQGNTLSYCLVYSNARAGGKCAKIQPHKITHNRTQSCWVVLKLFGCLRLWSCLKVFASLPQNDPLALNST